jgi:phage shock protein PspC (stress-responsive transcriptional regulator)
MSTTENQQVDARDNSLAGARAWFAERGLTRPREGRILAGVFAAFARRYDVNPVVARLLGITTIIVLSPLVYVAAWIVMPGEPKAEPVAAATA